MIDRNFSNWLKKIIATTDLRLVHVKNSYLQSSSLKESSGSKKACCNPGATLFTWKIKLLRLLPGGVHRSAVYLYVHGASPGKWQDWRWHKQFCRKLASLQLPALLSPREQALASATLAWKAPQGSGQWCSILVLAEAQQLLWP